MQKITGIVDFITNSQLESFDHIDRFNGTNVHKKESNSQHSYWVGLFSNLILENLFPNIDSKPVWKLKYETLSSSLTHDFLEIFSGDLVFHFKYNPFNGEEVRKVLKEFEDNCIKHICTDYKGNTNNPSGNMIYYNHGRLQNEGLIKSIQKVADWLACIKYEYQEVMLGNKYMQKNGIIDKSFKEILDWIKKLEKHYNEFCDKNDIYLETNMFVPLKNKLSDLQKEMTHGE